MIYGIRLNSRDGRNPQKPMEFADCGEARAAFALEKATAPNGTVGALYCQSELGGAMTLERFVN